MEPKLYFSDVFEVDEETLEDYGAFNISLVTDLPLFIDPFLLFNSENPEYQQLHEKMIEYLRFLKRQSEKGRVTPGLLKAWYFFSEVKQNWLGFCGTGNSGRGLGRQFASSLDKNLTLIFKDFGDEKITRGSHLEKLCLIGAGVGRDMISDFTTNLIKDYLLNYTQDFASKYIDPKLTQPVAVNRACFDYTLQRWMPKKYVLPFYDNDYVILTPRDILTKDDTWINHSDMVNNFAEIPEAIENDVLRGQINNYLYSRIPEDRELTKDEYVRVVQATLSRFPELMDYYIRKKENDGDEAVAVSWAKVSKSQQLYIRQFGQLVSLLAQRTGFYECPSNTKDETREKIMFLKDVIENKGGHRIFYVGGEPIRKEEDLQILFRLVWHGTPSDVSREVNDGRGQADFKISRGAHDKSLVEFKLARNTQLKRNLARQLEIYKKASDAQTGFKVILYFTEEELEKVEGILRDLDMKADPNIYLIDGRLENKPSGSKA
ncbi:MAG: hypothetical protein AB1733_19280 [Thermodesulfobacteriota bacterium]